MVGRTLKRRGELVTQGGGKGGNQTLYAVSTGNATDTREGYYMDSIWIQKHIDLYAQHRWEMSEESVSEVCSAMAHTADRLDNTHTHTHTP